MVRLIGEAYTKYCPSEGRKPRRGESAIRSHAVVVVVNAEIWT